jgi:hypothetical protein
MITMAIVLVIALVIIGYVVFGKKTNKGEDVPER